MNERRAVRFAHPDVHAGTSVADDPAHEPAAAGLGVSAQGRLAMVDGTEALRQSILLLLSTRPGERVMRPAYGCHLHRLVFSPNDDTTAGLAMHYVRSAVAQFEPRAEIVSVDATCDTHRSEVLAIALTYRERGTARREELRISFDLQGNT
jgi:uncharacterized protein